MSLCLSRGTGEAGTDGTTPYWWVTFAQNLVPCNEYVRYLCHTQYTHISAFPTRNISPLPKLGQYVSVRQSGRFITSNPSPNWKLHLHSQTLPWGAVCKSCTLKSRPARSCRSCVLSMPRTRSGSKKRWSIPSWGPCCCCLLVAVGVALDAVSILDKAHLTRTSEHHTQPRTIITTHKHEQRTESHWAQRSTNRPLAEPRNPLTFRQYPRQADTVNEEDARRGGGKSVTKKWYWCQWAMAR